MSYDFAKMLTAKEVNEELVRLDWTDSEYVTISGKFFKKYKNGKFFPRKLFQHKNGYVYVQMSCGKKNSGFRVHRVMARTFIPNPLGLNVVGHKNNVKNDNSLENLYWTTIKENTQKAYDDGLMVNDIGIEDSQSFHISLHTNSGELVAVYGSISSAGKLVDGWSKSSISKVVSYKPRKGIKGFYFLRISAEEYALQDENIKEKPFKVISIPKLRTDIKVTSKISGESKTFSSQKEASKWCGIAQATISSILSSKSETNYTYIFERCSSLTTIETTEDTRLSDGRE